MKFYRDLKNCVIFFRTIFRTTILLNSVKLQYVLNAQSLQQTTGTARELAVVGKLELSFANRNNQKHRNIDVLTETSLFM